MEKERIEAMQTILDDMGINSLTEDQVKELTKSFLLHLEMEREMQSYQFSVVKSECVECKSLKAELKEANRRVDVYHKNVCERRKTEDVWIEGDRVMFRP